jgi:hypothetical protein
LRPNVFTAGQARCHDCGRRANLTSRGLPVQQTGTIPDPEKEAVQDFATPARLIGELVDEIAGIVAVERAVTEGPHVS